MFCTNCGSKVEGEFCPKCGQKVGAAVAAAAVDTKHGPVRRLWNGRIGRLNYFLGTIFGLAPLFILVSLWGIVRLATETTDSSADIFNAIVPILIALSLVWWFVFHLFLAIRRCHDIGTTGWLALTTYIPYLGLIPALFFLFKKGEEGSNDYGHPPRDRGFFADIFNY